MAEQPATNNQSAPLVEAIVHFSSNKLEAALTIKSNSNGQPLSLPYLHDVLVKNTIVNGINEATLLNMVQNPVFSEQITVARGTEPIVGDKAILDFKFNLHRDLTPKLREDGSVDFKDLGLIQTVAKGTLLVVKTPRTEGKAGIDVCGQPIPPKPAQDASIPVGRNVVLSEDRLQLFANTDGQVDYINDRVSVLDVYSVDGDVSMATGNIDFNGNIFVKGSVQTGFVVKAAGNIEVNGMVEGAVLEAGGNIIIREGFNGAGKGSLKAGDKITSKFIQGGTVTLGGKLETSYIYNSIVRSGDSVHVVGKGIIVGGHVIARTRIDAGTIGNENLTATIVEVGSDPEVLKRHHAIPAELDACRKNIKALEAPVDLLMQLKAAGRLAPEKEEQLTKTRLMLIQLGDTEQALLQEQEAIGEKVAEFGKGFISVRNAAHPGVKLVMGSEQVPLKSKYVRTLFSRAQGYIKGGPL